jgi:hypothetical protein
VRLSGACEGLVSTACLACVGCAGVCWQAACMLACCRRAGIQLNPLQGVPTSLVTRCSRYHMQLADPGPCSPPPPLQTSPRRAPHLPRPPRPPPRPPTALLPPPPPTAPRQASGYGRAPSCRASTWPSSRAAPRSRPCGRRWSAWWRGMLAPRPSCSASSPACWTCAPSGWSRWGDGGGGAGGRVVVRSSGCMNAAVVCLLAGAERSQWCRVAAHSD